MDLGSGIFVCHHEKWDLTPGWFSAKTISFAKNLRRLHQFLCGIKLICIRRI